VRGCTDMQPTAVAACVNIPTNNGYGVAPPTELEDQRLWAGASK